MDDLEERLTETQAKAEAYDRIMSGGKKTLKEWANIFGLIAAVSKNGSFCFFYNQIPEVFNDCYWLPAHKGFASLICSIPINMVEHDGPWDMTLELPDGWEEK